MDTIEKIRAKSSPKNQFHGQIATVMSAAFTYVAAEVDDIKIKLIAGALAAGFAAIARRKALKVGKDER